MKGNTSKYFNYFLFIIVISFFWTCSPKLSYEVKSFLFDGVPNPYKVEVTVIQDSLTKAKELNTANAVTSTAARNDLNIHAPYQERKCTDCHTRDRMGKPKLPMPELCNQCHEDFTKKYTNIHGPIATGNCTECHNPHQSKFKKLLKFEGQDLCLNCHTSTQVAENKVHKDINTISCTECHNPHGGSNKFNLEKGSCYKCHDNFEKKLPFLHGPVVSDNCSQCHDSHTSTSEKLLLDVDQKLCYKCHNPKEVKSQKHHQTMKGESCTKCHNPHGGTTANFLKISSK